MRFDKGNKVITTDITADFSKFIDFCYKDLFSVPDGIAESVFKTLFLCNDIWVMVILDNVFVAFRFYNFRFCNVIYG